MKNLDSNLCFRFRDARREAGLSQQSLAMEIGCNQSAISMFEKGDPTKLSGEMVEKLARKFGIDLTAPNPHPVSTEAIIERHSGYCPNPSCPSHTRYTVDGETFFRPNPEETDPVGGKYCAVCGEVLLRRCTHCGAKLHPGAVCSMCGKPYVC